MGVIAIACDVTVRIRSTDDAILVSAVYTRYLISLQVFPFSNLLLFIVMLLKPLFVNNLLRSRIETHAPLLSNQHSTLRVLVLKLLDCLVAVPDLRKVSTIEASFLDQLAF